MVKKRLRVINLKVSELDIELKGFTKFKIDEKTLEPKVKDYI